MPDRALPPTIPRILNQIFERLRAVERLAFKLSAEEEPPTGVSAYSWQSAISLAPGLGHKLHADRDGTIAYIRAERSAADGTSTAEFDVLHNGSTMFSNTVNPTIPAGEAVGPEISPTIKSFRKGDSLQVEILQTGGGSGPLRVTIRYDPEIGHSPPNEFDEV